MACDLQEWPDLARQVLEAASRDPNKDLRRWAACSRFGSAETFRGWFERQLRRGINFQITEELLRPLATHFSAEEVVAILGLESATWVLHPPGSLVITEFLYTPVGLALTSRALEGMRAGTYRDSYYSFESWCRRHGERMPEWIDAGISSKKPLRDIGFSIEDLNRTELEPVEIARFLAALPADWDEIVSVLGRKLALEPTQTADTGAVEWPRDVLKALLTGHPAKEVRLEVIKLLTPPQTTAQSSEQQTAGGYQASTSTGNPRGVRAPNADPNAPKERKGLMARLFG